VQATLTHETPMTTTRRILVQAGSDEAAEIQNIGNRYMIAPGTRYPPLYNFNIRLALKFPLFSDSVYKLFLV